MNINYKVLSIIITNPVYIDNRDNYLKCFYKFGSEEIGAVLIKGVNTMRGYKTNMVPDTPVTKALIEYCKYLIG